MAQRRRRRRRKKKTTSGISIAGIKSRICEIPAATWKSFGLKYALPLLVLVLLVSGVLYKPMDKLLLLEQRNPMYNSFFEKSRGIEFSPDPESGEIGFAFRISKPWLSKLSAGDLNLLFNNVNRAYHGKYATVVLDFMDGTGLQFKDCRTKEVAYGTLNEHGIVTEPEGYVRKKKGAYVMTDTEGNPVTDAREKLGINGFPDQPDPAGGELNQIVDLTVYLQALQDPKYTFYMIASDGGFGNLSWVQQEELKWIGIPEDFLEGFEYSHAIVSDRGAILDASTTVEPYTMEGTTEGGSTYHLEHASYYAEGGQMGSLQVDGTEFYQGGRGITIVVRDVEKGAVVDSVFFDTSRYQDKRIACIRFQGGEN